MTDEGKKSWLEDAADSYGSVRLWVAGVLAPVVSGSQLIRGNLALGLGLGMASIAVWTVLARRLGVQARSIERIGNVSMAVGLVLMAWHVVSWFTAK